MLCSFWSKKKTCGLNLSYMLNSFRFCTQWNLVCSRLLVVGREKKRESERKTEGGLRWGRKSSLVFSSLAFACPQLPRAWNRLSFTWRRALLITIINKPLPIFPCQNQSSLNCWYENLKMYPPSGVNFHVNQIFLFERFSSRTRFVAKTISNSEMACRWSEF